MPATINRHATCHSHKKFLDVAIDRTPEHETRGMATRDQKNCQGVYTHENGMCTATTKATATTTTAATTATRATRQCDTATVVTAIAATTRTTATTMKQHQQRQQLQRQR